jgi:catechol 2,3-dioxygenase-like lactoylglutathione lyase family enzyme
MLDHISIPVVDLERAGGFYDVVLTSLGMVRRKQREGAIGYGPITRPAPVFWILQQSAGSARAGTGLHISFQAADRASVDAFHRAGLDAGGRDAGQPGARPHYTQPFYGAFLFDLDGFKIEAVCRA